MDRSSRRKLLVGLRRAGWTVEWSSSGHIKIRNPGGVLVTTTGNSPSDWRGSANLLRDLRAAGFAWPPARRGRRGPS